MSTTEYTAEEVLNRYKQMQKTTPEVVPETTQVSPDAPKAYTAADVLARHKQGFSKPVMDNSIPKEIESTLSQRLGEKADKRREDISTFMGELRKDPTKQSLNELMKRPGISDVGKVMLGQTAGMAMDVTGEVIMSGLSNASDYFIDLVVPDDVQEGVKNKYIEGVNWLTSTDAAKVAIDALEGGAESYNKWKSDNPSAAIVLESVIDLGTFFAPPAKRAALPPAVKVKPPAHVRLADVASEQVEKLKTVFDKRAARKYKEENLEAAYQYVMPIKLEESRLKDVTPRGFARRAKVEPNQLEADSIEWLASLKGLKPSKGMLYNYKVINDKNLKLLHMNPGAAGKSGLHQQITMMRFTIDKKEIKDLEILEIERSY